MARVFNLQAGFGILALALALVLLLRSDLAHMAWMSKLSKEGSPPPARDVNSPTGYELGQRHFLAAHQRGETYRWIAETQEFVASGPWTSPVYDADTPPHGRPKLFPTVFTAWLAAVAWGLHLATEEPIAIAAEQAALWEPVISHVLAFALAAAFMWRRHGPAGAGVAGLCFAVFPPLSGQFLPGALSTMPWALLLAAYAIALNLPGGARPGAPSVFSTRSAVAASFALWLDPAFGFPAVLLSAAAGAGAILTQKARFPSLVWSLTGAGVTLAAWLVDQAPWSPAAGELRYVHPLYALAWLGIGLGLDGWQNLRSGQPHRNLHLAKVAAAVPLVSALAYTQLNGGYKAWLHTSASMRRLTSLDETTLFNSVIDWYVRASLPEAVFVSAPVLAAIAALAWSLRRRADSTGDRLPATVVSAIITAGVVTLALFKIRWGVVASLVALPLVWDLASRGSVAFRRVSLAVCAAFVAGLIAWGSNLPAALQKPSRDTVLSPADLEALVYRHFSHWMASHHPGQPVSALAPPEMSDSLVFHGGCRVLMSSAWESYPGLVAASRVLSAPEASEAGAVLESLELTHVLLTSWDKVLPLLVRDPEVEGKDTLYARLQRWVLPLYLRPVPYRLPSVPGYLDQKLAVFKVTAPQDEALLLSRLAEFFAEMDRPEPAGLVAKVLADSFADDPNASIARATVYAHAKDRAGFERELARLAADATAGRVPFSWDRRVQRAIILALGRERELAQAEIAACAASASKDEAFELTPLQAHRLGVLARSFGLTMPDPGLDELLASLGREYATAPSSTATR